MLSQVTRFSTCTSNAWKWMGCVSTPLWVIFQICVPSPATAMGVASTAPARGRPVASMISVGGIT
jgi:hypothetical protein